MTLNLPAGRTDARFWGDDGRLARHAPRRSGAVGEQRFGINDHLINSVRNSGRRQVTPEDLNDALRQHAAPASQGSRSYTNPGTGSRFFVNDSDEMVGVYPKGFK